MAFFSLFLQADGSGGGGSGGRKNRRGLTTMSLNESRGSAGGGDRGITGGVSTYVYGILWFGSHYINSFITNFVGPDSKMCTWKVRAA